jgi:hypothetical protein
MNKSILALFFIILLLLIIWNTIPYAYHLQKQFYNKEIMQTPVLVISASGSRLDSLAALLQDQNIISKIVIERDSLITEKLIKNYQLEKARSILLKYDLPDVMHIYLEGNETNYIAYKELEDLVSFTYPDLKFRYDPDMILRHDLKSDKLFTIYFLVNAAVALFVLILITFLRYHFEVKKNYYWKIFREAGGRSNHRNRQYWLNSVLLILSPVALILAIYYLLSEYNLITFRIDQYLFIIQFTILLLGSFLSRIFLGVKS